MASAQYNQWVARVKADGGRVAVAPSGVPSAAYPATVYVPKVNSGTWPLPSEYSNNGQTAYYHAPAALMDEIRSFSAATPAETQTGANQLLDQWGIPDMFRGLKQYAGTLLTIGAIYFLVMHAMKSKGGGARRWE